MTISTPQSGAHAQPVKGWKLVRKDYSSLRAKGRVTYRPGEWQEVPGRGAYVAVRAGLLSGGDGPVLLRVECDPSSRTRGDTPDGVETYTRVRTTLPTTEELAQAAEHAEDPAVRRSAVLRLTDQVLLGRVAEKDGDWDVRRAAVWNLTDQEVLARVAEHAPHWWGRRAAVERLDDQAVLARVAETDAEWSVRRAAVERFDELEARPGNR